MPELTELAAAATTLSAVGIWRTIRASRQAAAEWRELLERKTAEREIPVPRQSEPPPRKRHV